MTQYKIANLILFHFIAHLTHNNMQHPENEQPIVLGNNTK